jgi:hypothetical protein
MRVKGKILIGFRGSDMEDEDIYKVTPSAQEHIDYIEDLLEKHNFKYKTYINVRMGHWESRHSVQVLFTYRGIEKKFEVHVSVCGSRPEFAHLKVETLIVHLLTYRAIEEDEEHLNSSRNKEEVLFRLKSREIAVKLGYMKEKMRCKLILTK